MLQQTDDRWQIWIDRGGTFTDVVARSPDGAVVTAKYLSEDPARPGDAAVNAIRELTGAGAGTLPPLALRSLASEYGSVSETTDTTEAPALPRDGLRETIVGDLRRQGIGIDVARNHLGVGMKAPGGISHCQDLRGFPRRACQQNFRNRRHA